MRYVLAASLGLFVLAAIDTASAADLALKAPATTAATPAYDWTGFYVGGNIGYGVAGDPSQETFITPVGTPFADESFTLSPGGALGGAQMGANFQTGKWIFGAEGDWQWSGQRNLVCVQSCSVNIGALNSQLTVDQQIAWLATMRGRLGYADGAFLWYATAGGAWGRVDTNYVSSIVPASFDHTLGGWAIGGGVEAAVTGNWTAKLEYLYIGLGAINDTFTGPFNGSQSVHSDIRENIVRLGLNYRFGTANGTAPPLLAATTSSSNWTGAYVGANGGYGFGRYTGHETLTPSQTAQSFAQAPDGGLLGAQAGYNWQNGNWVSGIEGDWQWVNQRDSISITLGTPGNNINNDGLALSDTLRWLATLRGRLGYNSGDWLWYVTGGGAFAGAEESDTLTFGGITAGANFNRTLGGWTAGAGVEKVISGNWSAKLEYLYVNLGSVTDSFALAPGAVETVHQNVTDNIVRLGLNYHL
jgi:outer membrane immunogenic protein